MEKTAPLMKRVYKGYHKCGKRSCASIYHVSCFNPKKKFKCNDCGTLSDFDEELKNEIYDWKNLATKGER
jgi:hypothetical protein